MTLLAIPIIAVLSLFLVIFTSAVLFIYFNKLKINIEELNIQVQSTNLLVDEIQLTHNKLQLDSASMAEEYKQFILENAQVSKQLEHRIKKLQQHSNEQDLLMEQWKNDQGQDKFYNRAFKLASKGADIEEIMNECELPRAEVEMLLSVYQQRLRNQ